VSSRCSQSPVGDFCILIGHQAGYRAECDAIGDAIGETIALRIGQAGDQAIHRHPAGRFLRKRRKEQ
jgi:hypothetical protein